VVTALLDGGHEPTYRTIAAGAHVRERTVYRHFPTRRDLEEALWEHVEATQLATATTPDGDDEVGRQGADGDAGPSALLAAVATRFEAYERHHALVAAMLRSPGGRDRLRAHEQALGLAVDAVAERSLATSPETARRRAAAAARVLCSATCFTELRAQAGGPGDVAAVAQQALVAVLGGAPAGYPGRMPRDDAVPMPAPEDPQEEGIAVPEPTIEEVEPVHLLANEARGALTARGFSDEQIDEWARTFIAECDGGTAEDLLAWISEHEGHHADAG
jgi:AcrR family transcriptional regulator